MVVGGLGLGKEGQGCAVHATIHHFLILDLLYKKKGEFQFFLLVDLIHEGRKGKGEDEENCVNSEFGILEKCFRLLHDLFFSKSFSEKKKKIKNNKGRKIKEILKLEDSCEIEIGHKKNNSTDEHTEKKRIPSVFSERASVVTCFFFQKPELRESLGHQKKIPESPPTQQ